MMLAESSAQQLLREALYDAYSSSDGSSAPKLWAYQMKTVYCFHWGGEVDGWHGFQEDYRIPPTSVLRTWKDRGMISNAEYKKMLSRRNRYGP